MEKVSTMLKMLNKAFNMLEILKKALNMLKNLTIPPPPPILGETGGNQTGPAWDPGPHPPHTPPWFPKQTPWGSELLYLFRFISTQYSC